MPRIRRRQPARRPDPAAPSDARATVCRWYGWPPDVDMRRLGDPDYRDVIEAYRRSVGWTPEGAR